MSTITFDFRHHYQRGERREAEQVAYQWDLGHVAEIFVPLDATYNISYCFSDYDKTDDYAVESITAADDGGYKLTAHVPNKYFERSRELRVYVVGSADDHIITTYEGFITIRGRLMPDDYVDDDPENGATQIIEVAREYATKSQSYAVGGTGTREGEDTDNAKYYLEQAEAVAESIPEDYSDLSDDVDQLKNALNTVCQANSIVIPSSGTYYLPFEAKSGDVIEITAGANGINVWSQNSSSQNVDEKWVSANTTVTLTLSADIVRFKIYTSAASSALFINTSIGILPDYLDKIDLNTANILTCVKGIKRITNGNYSTDLPNLNNAEKNSIYLLVFGSTNPITNYPGNTEGSTEYLFTFGVPGTDYKLQLLFKSEQQILKRKYINSWSDWQLVSRNKEVHIGPGQDFTTLKAGIARAIQFNGTKVIVHPKSNNAPYDLTQEFATEIAADQTGVKFGIKLENDVHVMFETGTKVKALCENVSANITAYFNPFYAGTDGGGYTLENLDIDASNTRYCLHDEAAAATTPRTVKILNCKMVFDNRTAAIDWYGQCLGGGLGINDYIEIRGCYFDSKRRSQPSSTAGEIASYHNNGVASHAVSRIVVSDCYFAGKGTFKFSYWGTTEEISEGIINNCSLGSEIIVRQEQSQNQSPENIDVLEFNNVVRN